MNPTQDQLAKWKVLAMTWHEAPPPASPSQDDVLAFQRLSSPSLEFPGDVVILGSTPALRRLFGSIAPGRVVCLDFCREMYEAASRYVPSRLVKAETYVEAQWTNIAEHVRKASVIVGDKSLDNVPFSYWPELFEGLATALQYGGRAVLHVAFPDPEMRNWSFSQTLEKWKTLVSTGIEIDIAASGLWEDLLSGSARSDDRDLTLGRFRADIEAHSSDSVVQRLTALFGSSLDDSWTRFDMADLQEVALKTGLSVTKVEYANDYVSAPFQPICCLLPSDRSASR